MSSILECMVVEIVEVLFGTPDYQPKMAFSMVW
jgi:hypothetical protein